MDFDFGFDGGEDNKFDFNKSFSKSGKKKGSAPKRKKKVFGKAFKSHNPLCDQAAELAGIESSAAADPSNREFDRASPTDASVGMNSSFSSSTSSIHSRTTKSTILPTPSDMNSRRSKRRIRRRQEEKEYYNDDDDEVHSTRSHVSLSCGASSGTDGNSIATGRSRSETSSSQFMVRRGVRSSAYAVQDAGTHQMIHDECSYLCSTILSRMSRPSKTIDAAIELATLLSSRKTRSMLWQGGSRDGDDNQFHGSHEKGPSSSNGREQSSTIPKVWSSIFEVLALAATTCGSFGNCSSSNSSISSTASAGSAMLPTASTSTKYRTKSARRKEKELLQTGGCMIGAATQTTDTTKQNYQVTTKGNKLDPNLKDILACIIYFVSWDCTMSGDHSIAAIGAIKSSSIARKIRLAILERGAILHGILRLMAPSQPLPESTPTVSFPKLPSFSFSTTTLSNSAVSPLRAPTKRSLRPASSKASSSTKVDVHAALDETPTSSIHVKTSLSSKNAGDPTALGRRKRKNRRRQKEESSAEDQVPQSLSQIINADSISEHVEGFMENQNDECMPPPKKRSASLRHGKVRANDELSFGGVSVQNRLNRNSGKGEIDTNNDANSSISEVSIGGTSTLSSLISQKIETLRAKVLIESSPRSSYFDVTKISSARDDDFQRNILANNGIFLDGDRPWLSIVCLESLTRILTGKELNGKTSCLEGEDMSGNKDSETIDDNNAHDDDDDNVVMVTNRLVGKSGIIPLLASAMSESMAVATKLIFRDNCQKDENSDGSSSCAREEYWNYCYSRLKLLTSLIDEACFFSERNRTFFCEDDPFSFQDRKKGLIFHILTFLHDCSRCDLTKLDMKRSETMSLALRTLTSLTHDNPLAAEQMKSFHDCNVDLNSARGSDNSIQGIHVIANLVFQLEESQITSRPKPRRSGSKNGKEESEHDMHRYDGTIFCLTTLANITEGVDIGRVLMEIKLVLKSGKILSWIDWLCQWLVKQTETFRKEILSIGVQKHGNRGCVRTVNTDVEDEELQRDEEEKLVAAGNGCVVLACLITESDGDPESSICVRNRIKKHMPLNTDGSSCGVLLIINTLKAYCNYYQMSMGEMSVAIVSPVRKLIIELEEIEKEDEDLLVTK